MKTYTITCLLVGAAAVHLCPAPCNAQTVPGIPEPGLIIYGPVTNTVTGLPLFTNNVLWQVTGGAPVESATINSTIASVNGRFFYIARLPFETRSVGGLNFQKTPNTLGLTTSTATYTRTATVGGTNATLMYSSRGMLGTFTFGAADRGLVERLDLRVTLPGQSSQDTDGDGMPDWAELIAGTNPADPNSVFKTSTDIQPAPGGGLIVRWASVAGKKYAILRTTDLSQPFTPLATALDATAPQNEYTDSSATGPGPYFYRISVQ